jgi:SAM-dependent methyltransferase
MASLRTCIGRAVGPAGRRRGGRWRWIWVLLTVGIVLNGLRLRDRLARIPSLADEPDQPVDPDADISDAQEQEPLFEVVSAAGVVVDDATVRAATAHARREGLTVVDLVPADLGSEQALELARAVDTSVYRSKPLHPGRGARHAMVVEPALLARAGLARISNLDPVEMVQAAARLKQYAPRSTDLVVAPGVAAVADDPDKRLNTLWALAGPAATIVGAMPVVQYGLIAAGALVNPAWAAAAAVAATLQPHLATGGTAVRPADLRGGSWLARCVRLPLEAARTRKGTWRSEVVVSADPRAIEERRPVYRDLLAEGTDRFFEERRTTCPWCESPAITPRLTTIDLTQRKPGQFAIDDCDGCGHVFQNPRLSLEGLDFYYRDFYDGLGAEVLEAAFAAVDTFYRARVRQVAAETTPNRWLDVGGGHGHFCLIAAEDLPDTRFDVLDLNDGVLEAAQRGWVDHAHQGLFTDVAPEIAGTYDVVSMHHYLEHTRDPRDEVTAAHIALAPGGLLLIEVPDPENTWSRIVGPYWGSWLQPQHQHFVPIGNLRQELESQGFTVVSEERAEAHQAFDYTSFVGLVAQRLSPPPEVPWLHPPTAASQAVRLAVLAGSLPIMGLTFAAEQGVAPLVRNRPGGPNTYRILARKD